MNITIELELYFDTPLRAGNRSPNGRLCRMMMNLNFAFDLESRLSARAQGAADGVFYQAGDTSDCEAKAAIRAGYSETKAAEKASNRGGDSIDAGARSAGRFDARGPREAGNCQPTPIEFMEQIRA
jgi:hypothetical protein